MILQIGGFFVCFLLRARKIENGKHRERFTTPVIHNWEEIVFFLLVMEGRNNCPCNSIRRKIKTEILGFEKFDHQHEL